MKSILSLDAADARSALEAMREALVRDGLAAVIVVADAHGDLLALERLDGAPASSVTIARNKAFTAASEGVPSRMVGNRVRSEERLDVAYYGDARMCGWGGGLPVTSKGRVIGSVAVSGLPEEVDERIAAIG